MKIHSRAFNTYLLLAPLLFAIACKSSEERKRDREVSTLRLHLETSITSSDRSGAIPVYRQNPVLVKVENSPILDEANIIHAAVVEDIGGFAIQVKYDSHGTLVLNTQTTANRGRRLAVFSHFGQSRWLAAPQITGPILNGTFTFTPDATREEAERIVRGLNNVTRKLTKKFPY